MKARILEWLPSASNIFTEGTILRSELHCKANFGGSIEFAATYNTLKPHVQPLLQQVLFPCMSLSSEEVESFESDPVDFVRAEFGTSLLFFTHSCLTDLCRCDGGVLQPQEERRRIYCCPFQAPFKETLGPVYGVSLQSIERVQVSSSGSTEPQQQVCMLSCHSEHQQGI